jgi:hypothetical protein
MRRRAWVELSHAELFDTYVDKLTFKVDGKVYSPSGGGVALDGSPLLKVQAAQQLMWELSRREEDFEKRLGEVDGVPQTAYWLPTIYAPVPGFEEYAGFVNRSTFVPVGRLL